MNRYAGTARWAALLSLSVVTLSGAGACSGGGESGPPSLPSSSSSSRTGEDPGARTGADSRATAVADEAKAVLEGLLVERESLGGGSGVLAPQFGNTHPATPEGVVSVTFVFTCTGGGEVKLRNEVEGKDVPSAAGTQECDGSLYQASVDVPGPDASIGFTATPVENSADGGYAYAYYVEKKNLP
ncbi:hypothetical protein [Streptomyces cyaneofuscatus]|uniref:Lipoprotein n=1 Tax=Streptomyces cyaneofuscatus TaxID=66883 RepID=A0ABZ1EXZ6_9ACTN|nr:hypothetical protein [Streptomyces cyaneofuscatus]WSB09026.1 hypothetical protein OG849_18100 [Streptomyces cyaneofuscatus]WSD47440.1 hypothetical protein OG857_17305 [Streptomyces cyaneofuscatus]